MKRILIVSAFTLVLFGGWFGMASAAGMDIYVSPPVVIGPHVVMEEGPYFSYEPRGPYGYWGGGDYEGRHYERGHYGNDYRESHNRGFREHGDGHGHNHGEAHDEKR